MRLQQLLMVKDRQPRITERAQQLCAIGLYLKRALPQGVEGWEKRPLSSQRAEVGRLVLEGRYLEALAFSVLVCDVVVQVAVPWRIHEDAILSVLETVGSVERKATDAAHLVASRFPRLSRWLRKGSVSGFALRYTEEREVKPFVIKEHPGAEKANLWASDVMRWYVALGARERDQWIRFGWMAFGLYNDQVCAALLYAAGVADVFDDPLCVAMRIMWTDQAELKAVNTVLKSSGANATLRGAKLCELVCLKGRGIGALDEAAQAYERTRCAVAQGYNTEDLRRAVREVLHDELDLHALRRQTTADWWSSRWLWCVNGAHSRALERHEPALALGRGGRAHRKEAIEAWAEDPTRAWNGKVYVNTSQKLEHGKTRLLLACDTRSYLAFDELLKPVEAAWRNERVLLDPGRYGPTLMAEKLRAMRGMFYLMADYDDFNSQHTLDAQAIVIDETCRYVGYDAGKTETLVRSFSRMLITSGGRDIGYARGTLMSGHRATSYINTVLNAAYVKLAVGQGWYSFASYHAGDDVVARFNEFDDIAACIDGLRRLGFKLNQTKQSTGDVVAEFLREAVTPQQAQGYLARAVASAVSGNWTTEAQLSGAQYLTNAVVNGRTLINRSGGRREIATVFVDACNRRTHIAKRLLRQLVMGEVGLNSGPVYGMYGSYMGMSVKDEIRLKHERGVTLPVHAATVDYLAHHVAEVEQMAFRLLGTSPVVKMVAASYAKSPLLDRLVSKVCYGVHSSLESYAMTRSCRLEDVPKRDEPRGALSRYPLLHMYKDEITRPVLRELLAHIGRRAVPGHEREQAWGYEHAGVVCNGFAPYTDAARACSRCPCSYVYTARPCYM